MPKKCTNDETNNGLKRGKSVADSEYNTLVDHNDQRKRLRRGSYLHNSENVVASSANTFICENSSIKYQCCSSASSADQFVIRCVNNEEILDTIPFKKENSVSDQKGKNVVSFLSSSENTVQKTLVADNRIAINKGQAFFQKNRNGVVERYMQGRPRPSASRVTVQGPKKLGAPKLLGWYIYICFYKSINL